MEEPFIIYSKVALCRDRERYENKERNSRVQNPKMKILEPQSKEKQEKEYQSLES
jgi:hypothetical protein